MKILTAKVVGTPGKSAWAQVHTFTPEDEKLASRGRITAALQVSVAGNEGEMIALGKEVLTRLHEEYYGKQEGTPFVALRNALQRLSEEFQESAELEVVAAVAWGGYLYLGVLGAGRGLLFRDGQLSPLLDGEKNKVRALSGKPANGDVLILATSAFFRATELKIISQALAKSTAPTDLVDNLAPVAQGKSNPGLAAAILKIVEPEAGKGRQVAGKKPEFRSWFRSTKDKLRGIFVGLALRLPAKGIEVSKKAKSPRRTAVSVGVVLIILLALSIGFGIRQKNLRDYRGSYEDRLTAAQNFYNDSLLQKDVNKASARESFLEAKNLVEELLQEGIQDPGLERLKKALEEQTAAVLGKVEVEPGVFLDLSLVRAGVTASRIAFDAGELAVFDKGGKRTISVTADEKKKTEVLGSEVTDPLDNALYEGRHFLLSSDRILELGRQEKEVVEDEWQDPSFLGAFGGNLYVLDKEDPSTGSGHVWRYPGTEAGFGSKQEWLGKGVEPDFSQISDMAIDGSIWLLSESGKVAKFTRGAPDAFSIKGIPGALALPRALYSDEDLESLYVLDSGNGRVVEIAKNGEYQKQYLWDGMGEVRDIAVSKEAGKIFLLTETKILEIPL